MMNRNLIAAYKYQIKDNVRSIIIFYCILIAVIVLISIGIVTSSSSGNSNVSGLDISTTIFIFIAGLVSFKEPFRMLMQNGVSRKTMMKTKLLSSLTLAAFMALCSAVLLILGKLLTSSVENFKFEYIYEQIYALKAAGQSGFAMQLFTLIFNFLQYIAVYTLGFFVSLIFYRCSKAGKIAVGAGVPVALFIVLPTVDALFFKMQISKSIIRFFDYAFGISAGRPGAALITFVIFTVIGLGLSWLLMRKADIKQ